MTDPILVRAARREPVERTPVWFMRQAGRSLPEYRAVRERFALFEICRQPELCAEVTLQPVRRHGVDAAVLFADIMLPVLGMGVDVELVEGVGPVVARPVETLADVEALARPGARGGGAVRARDGAPRARAARAGARASSASAAARSRSPATWSRAVRRASSRRTKALMYGAPEVWHALLDKLAETFARYVAAQVSAGADVVQVFDSWAGALSVEDYGEFAARYSARILGAVAAPTIHFATGATHLLPSLAAAGGDVIGLDWRVPLDEGWQRRRRRTAASRATSTRRRCSGRGSASSVPRAPCSSGQAAGRATSSTWATASCPRPTRTR